MLWARIRGALAALAAVVISARVDVRSPVEIAAVFLASSPPARRYELCADRWCRQFAGVVAKRVAFSQREGWWCTSESLFGWHRDLDHLRASLE